MELKYNEKIIIERVKKEHENGINSLIVECFHGKDGEKQKKRYSHLNYANPVQSFNPLGLVAICENKIVGYRGYVGIPFLFGIKKVQLLVPNTMATHPNYRRRGISKKLIDNSFGIFNDEYTFFLATSIGDKRSVIGRIRKKWKILGNKDYLYKVNFSMFKRQLRNDNITFEREVPSLCIKSIFNNSVFSENFKIRLDLNSTEFVNWIFNKEGYKWVVLRIKNKPMAYCCFKVNKNNCNLIHFDMILNDDSLKMLLQEIGNKYSIKAFYYFCTDAKSIKRDLLRKLGFWSTNNGLIRKIMRKEISPILIRPTIKEYDPSYFNIFDIDSTDVKNWDITKLSNF